MTLTRRGFLAAAGLGTLGVVVAGAAGVETRVLPGRDSLPTWLGGLNAGVPHASPGDRIDGSFVSSAMRGVRVGWSIGYPPGRHDRLPVLVCLHGRGGNHGDTFDSLHLDRYLATVVHAGTPPFAIASIDGGDHNYWHPRRDSDAAGLVTDEFVPLLAQHGLDTTRLGFLGWSMGGYGALYLAGRLGPRRVAVAVAESPAIWHEAGQSADGAFDDADDFDAHSILGHLSLLRGIALRIDCGSSDGFAPITRDLRAALSPTPAGGIEPGGHDPEYWRSQAAAQLRFAGTKLAG